MYLGICVEVADTLNVDHHQLVPRPLESEMAEGLRCLPTELVVDEARVGVVFHVVALNEVLYGRRGRGTSIFTFDKNYMLTPSHRILNSRKLNRSLLTYVKEG